MARLAKCGLDYFPLDIDFFQDFRIRKLIKCQGGKAVTVYTLLLCLIYKNGYFLRWDNELPFICSETTGFEEAFILEVIKCCLSLGLFNKNMYDKERVLTSKGIQVRFSNVSRMIRRSVKIDKYSLIDESHDDDPPRELNFAQASPMVFTQDNKPGKPVTWLDKFFGADNEEYLSLLCKNFGFESADIARLRSLAMETVNEWELSRTSHSDYSEWARHLISVMRIKCRNTANVKQPQMQAPQDYSFGGGFGGQDV